MTTATQPKEETLNVKITRDLKEKLQMEANEQRRTLSNYVQLILSTYEA